MPFIWLLRSKLWRTLKHLRLLLLTRLHLIHLSFVSLVHADTVATIYNLLVEVYRSDTSGRRICHIRLNDLRRPFVELCVVS